MRVRPTILPFKANRAYKAGQLVRYNHTVGSTQLSYILRARFDVALSQFDPLYFENTTPKAIATNTGRLLPQDTFLIRGEGAVKNNLLGYMSYAEAITRLSERSGHRDQIWVNGDITVFNADLYPKTNPNEQIVEYGWTDTTKIVSIYVEQVETDVLFNFTIKEQVYNLFNQFPSRFIVRFNEFSTTPTLSYEQTPDFSVNNAYFKYSDYYLNNTKDSVQSFRVSNEAGVYKVYKL